MYNIQKKSKKMTDNVLNSSIKYADKMATFLTISQISWHGWFSNQQ